MEIKSKNDIIDYFASGIKQDELIGVENEQFLFNIKTNKRAEYENIKKLLQIFITKFGWQEIKENENLKILGGIMGSDILDVAGVKNVATLPSLDEARAKIVGILASPAQKLVSILLAPGSKIANLARAKSLKK